MCISYVFFFVKQKTAYEMRISDWSSDVCSSDLMPAQRTQPAGQGAGRQAGRQETMTVSGEKLDVTGDGDGLRLVADNPSPGLAALRLGKSFKKRPVLRDVSLYVQRGEAVGLLGPNGAGKTHTF